MSNSNANYLLGPNKLSTRVHYAPGGASSLSLAWDDTPNRVQKLPPQNQQYMKVQKQQTQPHQNYSAQQQYQPQKNYYEAPSQNYPPKNQSNSILQEELRYYQNKNKVLRQNLFGGHDNIDQYNVITPKYNLNNQYGQEHYSKPQQAYQQYYSNQPNSSYGQQNGKYSRQKEQLDMFVQQQNMKRAQQKFQSPFLQQNQQYSQPQQYSQQNQGYYGGQYVPSTQQKTSVRVNNPPGGRSSIVFG